ncbi:hypothetical protein BDW66DRAFT_148744 [Aspergillus desertorum]
MAYAPDLAVVVMSGYDDMSFSKAQQSHDSFASSSLSLNGCRLSESDAAPTVSYDDPGTIGERLSVYWRATNETVIGEAYGHIADIPGKEIRRQRLDAFNEWYKVDEQSR